MIGSGAVQRLNGPLENTGNRVHRYDAYDRSSTVLPSGSEMYTLDA